MTGKTTIEAVQSYTGLNSRVWHIAAHPSRPFVSISLSSNSCKILNTESGEIVATLEDTHTRSVRASAWRPSSELCLATASFDGMVGIWVGWECVATLEGHESEVKSVSWNAGGDLLASCSRDKSVWVWEDDDHDYDCVAVLQEHTGDVKCVQFHPHHDTLVSCSYDETIRVYAEAEDGEWECIYSISPQGATIWAVSFSPDGRVFASCAGDGQVKVWSADNDFKHVATLPTVHTGEAYGLSWSNSGLLISTGGDGQVAVYSSEWLVLAAVQSAHGVSEVNTVACAGGEFFTGGDDGTVRQWRLS